MSKKILAAVLALAALFVFSCVSMSEGTDASLSKAKRLQNAAWDRFQKYGDTDAETLNLYNQAIEEYNKCVEANNKDTGEAYHNLGIIFFSGPKSLRSYSESAQYLASAAETYEREKNKKSLLPVCYNQLGTMLYRVGDYFSAFNYFKKASELSVQLAGEEAQLYWLGLGVEQDLPKAMEIYRKAAIGGRDLWANIYALDYQINEYKKGNYTNAGITNYLGYMHAMTMGEPKDVWMSILKQSADLGWPPAQVDYWIFCRDNNESGKGFPYLQKAVAANYIPAFFHMGYVYQMGLNNIGVNYQEAKKWYEKAAAQGFPMAQNNLGALYFNNNIASDTGYSNKVMSYYWWNEAAEQGLGFAIQNKQIVQSYRAPMTNLEASMMILNSVASIINNSSRTYSSLNRSRVQGYYPSSNSSSTSSSSSSSTINESGISSGFYVQNYQNMSRNVEMTFNRYRNATTQKAKDDALSDIVRQQQRMRQFREECSTKGVKFGADYYETARP